MKYLCDTNILLEIVLKRAHSIACFDFVGDHQKEIAMTSHAFFSFCIFAERFHEEKSAFDLMTFLLQGGLQVISVSHHEALAALREKDLCDLDLDDYIQYRFAKDQSLTLVTLDKDFFMKKLDIPVLRPGQVK